MREITIVGGGLAGLTLGILLCRRGLPTRLWEIGRYPRHRVCGEFVSGEGSRLLRDLLPHLRERMQPIETVRFFHQQKSTALLTLPSPGLSISRWELDAALAREFSRLGGSIHTERYVGPFNTPGLVRASGRRVCTRGAWTGLKAHAEKIDLSADLEMHYSTAGYLGISRLQKGANLCALVRSGSALNDFRRNPGLVFHQLFGVHSQHLTFDPASLCAVSGISFAPNAAPNECSVGDSMGMIPPFTGNGMSVALESAFAAAPVLEDYSKASREWPDVLKTISQAYRRQFRTRFAAAALIGSAANRSWTRALMLSTLRTLPGLFRICFVATR